MGRTNGGGSPTRIRDDAGNVLPDALPHAPVPTPEAPKHLPPGVRKAWAEIAGPMAAAGLLDRADAPALEAAARCVDKWRVAEALMDKEGVVTDAYGGRAHPAFSVAVKAQAEYRAWCARLGLTPVDRVSLGLASLRGQSLAQDIGARIGASPRKTGAT